MKIAVSAGHTTEDPGASIFDNISEYGETAAIVGQIVKHCQRAGHQCYLIGTGDLEDKVREINSLVNCDIAIEVHLNASGVGAAGCETLYCPGSEEGKRLAEAIHPYIAAAVDNPDRGIKGGYYRMDPTRGPDYFLAATNCLALIIEPYFIDFEHRDKSDNWTTEKIGIAVMTGAEEFINARS